MKEAAARLLFTSRAALPSAPREKRGRVFTLWLINWMLFYVIIRFYRWVFLIVCFHHQLCLLSSYALNRKQIINKMERGCLLLLSTVFYMSLDANRMSTTCYKTAAFFDKFSIWKLCTNRGCWFVFGCIQGKNDRESKYRNKKIAFFT